MSDSIKQVGVQIEDTITVYDATGNPVTGKINTDFTKYLLKNNTVDGTTVTITEINAGTRPGDYAVQWTPSAIAEYRLRIILPSISLDDWTAEYNVVAYSTDPIIRQGLAQAGAAATITLDSGASSVDSYYNGTTVMITSGTGAGQSRTISGYVGSTKVATVSSNWSTNPDSTSIFVILPVAGGGSAPTANQNADALLDRAGAIDGKTPRQALQYIAATTVEVSSGDPTGPVTFLGLDGATKRVKTTMDSSGNRIACQLDPP